ncbi:MAG: hypothetical protein HY323_19230 [Betaproteobacteria bacterium]|nr:hypothetical protein [Betaproteobacteria bacterium]MBI3939111.1 hypothetical protein [Betaproteobacteria bacterium]
MLSRPERYIFNRVWYEELSGEPEFTEYQLHFSRLSQDERAELIKLLSSTVPSKFIELCAQTSSRRVRDILEFYRPLTDEQEAEIWRKSREHRASVLQQGHSPPIALPFLLRELESTLNEEERLVHSWHPSPRLRP